MITSDEPAVQEDPHKSDADRFDFFPSGVDILQERACNLIHDLNRQANSTY